MVAILPNTITTESNQILIGGKSKIVAFIDSKGTFDVNRIITMMHIHVIGQLNAVDTMAVEEREEILKEIIKSALNRLLVFFPSSTFELAVTLKMMEQELKQRHGSTELGYIFIDRMDFQDAEQAIYMTHVIENLHSLITRLAPIVIVTQTVDPAKISHLSSAGLPFFSRQVLSPLWPVIITSAVDRRGLLQLKAHITLHSKPVIPFKAGISMRESIRLERSRTEESSEGNSQIEKVGVVRLRGSKEIGSFILEIKGKGVS